MSILKLTIGNDKREIPLFELIDGKWTQVEKDLPKWDAPDRIPLFVKPPKKEKVNKKKSNKYFDDLQNK